MSIEAYANVAHEPKGISAEMLTKPFQIGYDEAQQTLDTTTQLNRKNVDSKIFETSVQITGCFDTEKFTCSFPLILFVTGKAKSTRGNMYIQLFVSDKGYVFDVHIKIESEFPKTLKMFAKEVGVPLYLTGIRVSRFSPALGSRPPPAFSKLIVFTLHT